jgi:hypothetical protein
MSKITKERRKRRAEDRQEFQVEDEAALSLKHRVIKKNGTQQGSLVILVIE